MEERVERLEGGSREAEGAEAATGAERSSPEDRDSGGVLTLVCFKCGAEYFFPDDAPPESLTCAKCQNTVFRSFFASEEEDEAAADFREVTERDLRPDDAEGDTLPGDVIDLDRV